MLAYQTFFRKTDGTIWGCGYNGYDQLGLGDKRDKYDPVPLPSLIGTKMIVTGGQHTVVLKTDGTVLGCGNNSSAQLGLGHTANQPTPAVLPMGLGKVTKIACGGYHTLILKTDGTLWACGYNKWGQLGIGYGLEPLSFVQVTTDQVKEIACGECSSTFLKTDGTVWACGENDLGWLGIGNANECFLPARIPIDNVKKIVCGYRHTFFLKNDGTIWGCGSNFSGELGLGTDDQSKMSPVQIPIEGVKKIFCGGMHTIFLKHDGTVSGCGSNTNGELGIEDKINKISPVPIPIDNVNHVVCGRNYTMFLKTDGTIWCCGRNQYGELGIGDALPQLTPIQHPMLNVISLCFDDVMDYKYLLKDSGQYKTIANGQLEMVSEDTISASIMTTRGFHHLKDALPLMDQLSSEFEVLAWNRDELNEELKLAFIPKPQLIFPTGDIQIGGFGRIQTIRLTVKGTAGTIKMIVSADQGESWKTIENGMWVPIDPIVDAVGIGGIDHTELSSISQQKWEEIRGNTIRFAYYLKKADVTDTLVADALEIVGDMNGSWQRAKLAADYSYEYPANDLLQVKLLTDGSYKINYGGESGGGGKAVQDVAKSETGLEICYTDGTEKQIELGGSGTGTVTVKQVIRPHAVLQEELRIPVKKSDGFARLPVEVLKLEAGAANISDPLCGFRPDDRAGFTENELVEFDGSAKLLVNQKLNGIQENGMTSLNIDRSAMQEVLGMEVI